MPKSGIHGSIKGRDEQRVYLASDTFGGYVPPQAPLTELDKADRVLRDLGREIEKAAIPLVGKGSLDSEAQQLLGWYGRIKTAREFLVLAARKGGK